jgi:hypothetical protein
MSHNYLKTAGMAAIMLGSAFGVTQAATPTPPPDPKELLAQIKRPDGSLPQSAGGIVKGAKRAAPVLGWNFFVCTASQAFTDGANFTVVAHNSDQTFFAWTAGSSSNPIQNELVAACQHAGGGYFLHIINPSGAFDSVWIFYP